MSAKTKDAELVDHRWLAQRIGISPEACMNRFKKGLIPPPAAWDRLWRGGKSPRPLWRRAQLEKWLETGSWDETVEAAE